MKLTEEQINAIALEKYPVEMRKYESGFSDDEMYDYNYGFRKIFIAGMKAEFEKKLEKATEYGKILNDYIIIDANERPFIGNIGIAKVMDEMKKDFEQQLIQLGKSILKQQHEAYIFTGVHDKVVSVIDIIKAFDDVGVSIEDKIDF